MVDRDWRVYVERQREKDLAQITTEEKLKPEEAKHFIDNSFRDGMPKTTGTDFDRIMPPVSRFGGGGRAKKKASVILNTLAHISALAVALAAVLHGSHSYRSAKQLRRSA